MKRHSWDKLFWDELRRGRLVQCTPHRQLSDRSYYLIVPDRRSENALLQGFRQWLEAEARTYRESTDPSDTAVRAADGTEHAGDVFFRRGGYLTGEAELAGAM